MQSIEGHQYLPEEHAMDEKVVEQVRVHYAEAARAVLTRGEATSGSADAGCCGTDSACCGDASTLPAGAGAGFAYGVDMTAEMLQLARQNAAEAGATNVEFLDGRIEAVPLPDASVDVVISNCVINLSTDKPAVLAEMFRVLVPGGRLGITDVVSEDRLSAADRAALGD